jgi:hypothetical protein
LAGIKIRRRLGLLPSKSEAQLTLRQSSMLSRTASLCFDRPSEESVFRFALYVRYADRGMKSDPIVRCVARGWSSPAAVLYRLRINAALAQLGLRPQAFSSQYRQFMRRAGRIFGHSPQEVALFMVAQWRGYPLGKIRAPVVSTWIRSGSVNTATEQVRQAIAALNGAKRMASGPENLGRS